MNTDTMTASATTKKELDDALIIERVLNGDIELFEILMRRNNELLFRTIRSFLYLMLE